MKKEPCIILIGMPGAGKSTIGRLLATKLGYAFIDTDYLIEAVYGRRLQDVTESLTTEEFRDAECEVVCSLSASAAVIATGGSIIYRCRAIEHLRRLGFIIHLDSPCEVVEERILANPERGISFGPGQGLKDLYIERKAIYEACSDDKCDTSSMSADDCADRIIEQFQTYLEQKNSLCKTDVIRD